jgi:hypothetical protein
MSSASLSKVLSAQWVAASPLFESKSALAGRITGVVCLRDPDQNGLK